MSAPNLTIEEVEALFPAISDFGPPKRGGQKIAFPCTIQGVRCMLKIANTGPQQIEDVDDTRLVSADDIASRILRETDTIAQCDSPHLVKLGPLKVEVRSHSAGKLLCYSEEFIAGQSIDELVRSSSVLPAKQVLILGYEIGLAIKTLWNFGKVHRDITPNNIMRRAKPKAHVLLDMGFVLDTNDIWLTAPNQIPGTLPYLSPDQLDLRRKSQLDFRSDLFQLGVVMYLCLTGKHPFAENVKTESELIANILEFDPCPPSELSSEIPICASLLIKRLIAKHPFERFRTPDLYLHEVSQAIEELK